MKFSYFNWNKTNLSKNFWKIYIYQFIFLVFLCIIKVVGVNENGGGQCNKL